MHRKKILFVGLGGAVAEKLIPLLAETYDIVGVSGKRKNLKTFCVDFYSTDLFTYHPSLFAHLFVHHTFDGIVWNPVYYHPAPLIEETVDSLHKAFDMAVTLPLVCLREALEYGFTNGSFICVSSLLAFGVKPRWGAYSITKNGQVILAQYLAQELAAQKIHTKTIALGGISPIPDDTLLAVFTHALENSDPGKTLYKVNSDTWE